MSWIPLAERFSSLPLILAGPIVRRVEPESVTVWLALKEPCTVTLRVYTQEDTAEPVQQCEGTRHTIRLGDHLHLVAVTASTGEDARLHWSGLYYYDLFFRVDDGDDTLDKPVPETAPHLYSPGILTLDPDQADPLRRLVYPGQPLPGFVLPPEDMNQLRIVHGSCRKPHGAGVEMLSALDTILAGARGQDRPQQLFLTGDQIYADDVAPSLLFALIDAGDVLFDSNEEEVVPGVGVSAREVGPGERGPIVRYGAMFTTTTPQNQLMALREYAAMYLFAWSDVLWPPTIPDAQEIRKVYPQAQSELDEREKFETECVAQVPQLEGFRAALPHVRRALANIATYTICDDHEITDDWFLDGAWCQQVLASAPGRWIVRNGLLAYALFQAWGNTPQQFAEANGTALLNVVDGWRGDAADARVETIEEMIGLPKTFGGTGTLPRSPRALHWYHRYEGPRYQVILMDTRTQRLYRSPHDFPGLLSPEAMQEQVGVAARRGQEMPVTIIVSATPVLGVDFIESIQEWAHWFIRDNYAYDCEAWALEWGAFQHLLKTVSPMERVVFLSGDVHYAFGSSMEYWDEHTQATARLVDFTSSPFRNEGSGAHIAVLAIGYPRLLHLLRRQGTPTMDFFAWDITGGKHHLLDRIYALIRRRLYLFWWAIPRLIAATHSPDEVVLPAHGWLKGAFYGYPPDRVYRLRYLPNSLGQIPLRKRDHLRLRTTSWWLRLIRFALEGVTLLETGARKIMRSLLWRVKKSEREPMRAGARPALPARVLVREAGQGTNLLERRLAKPRNTLAAALLRSAAWLNSRKAGELIVGYNNLGEIFFTWTEQKKTVTQRLWYRADDATQHLLKVDYRETLELPALESMPPLP